MGTPNLWGPKNPTNHAEVTVDIGFTGTRQGMTDHQLAAVRSLLAKGGIGLAHHGDCVGADEQFHRVCVEFGIPVILHPPVNAKWRAFCQGAVSTEPMREYLPRNRDIVHQCELLIATPKEAIEPKPGRGQGTWSTVRYARTHGRMLLVVPPFPPK